MAEYKNSIAQDRVQFPIETIIRPQSGEQFSKVAIYIDSTDVATYLGKEVQAGGMTTILSSNYASETKGALLNHLALFFASATTGVVYVVVAQADDEDLSKTFASTKEMAYFKTALSETKMVAMNTAIAKLCGASVEDSQHFVTVADAITGGALPADSLSKALVDAKYPSFVKYHPSQDIAIAQIGKTISTTNGSGTPVGNSLDMIAMTNITASGANEANLSTDSKSNLDKIRVGYATSVSGSSTSVAIEGSMDLAGNSVGAKWMKAYISYMCRIETAGFITQGNIFNNSTSYTTICAILRGQVSSFEQIGRLKDVYYNFPSYAEAVKANYIFGDTINIPTAWEATYVDNVREVRIYGTLYVEQPTR